MRLILVADDDDIGEPAAKSLTRAGYAVTARAICVKWRSSSKTCRTSRGIDAWRSPYVPLRSGSKLYAERLYARGRMMARLHRPAYNVVEDLLDVHFP
ncbi:hypothetical protein [Caballeronia grimmiae]|uniref:hypothetical protein n=1 Tax=Caballeronia grimmiae TaxID=1071679 RepID=UPI0038B9A532